ncbi:MAG: radical SAM protein [Elusimicrobia bacterium]|nr:radical SAM protein [Elusimicrobiota bacterium]
MRTFGCRVNQAESQELRARLAAAGCAPAASLAEAGLCIVNTCSVTKDADREALKFLRRAGRENPAARLVVTGCLARRAPEDILRAAPQAQVALDPGGELGLPEAAAAAPERSRALLKVQDGCDGSCAYCVVPRVRPRLSSLPPAAAEERVRGLAAAGVPEIVLCGIRLGRYRDGAVALTGLLERLLRIPGAFRLRLSSLEVLEADEALAGLIAGSGGRLCPHLHIPLQSGSETVLRRMNRPYTAAVFVRRLEALRRRAPALALFSDIITGFPGETEAESRESLALVRSLGLCGLHVFRFSPRPGTLAAGMPGQVAPVAARERLESWQELDAELRRAHRRRAAGQRRVVAPLRGGFRGLTEDFLEVGLERPLPPGLWPVTLRESSNTAII